MAASYVVVGSYRSVQVIGPTQARNVQVVGIQTIPTQIYVEYPIPLRDWHDTQGRATLTLLSEQIEQPITEGLAIGGAYAQDVDANGLLTDYLDMIVAYTPPNSFQGELTTIVRIKLEAFLAAGDPFFARLAASPQSLLLAAYENLVATASQ